MTIAYPNLEFKALDVVDGLLKHRDHVHLIPIRNQGLQVLESFTYPLPPNLYQEWCTGKKSSDPYNNIFRLLTQQKYTQMPVMSQQIQLAMIKNLFSYKGNPSWCMR
jgi:hypothetical protein